MRGLVATLRQEASLAARHARLTGPKGVVGLPPTTVATFRRRRVRSTPRRRTGTVTTRTGRGSRPKGRRAPGRPRATQVPTGRSVRFRRI